MGARNTVERLVYDRPVAVIGDIHGCAKALDTLLLMIGDLPILVLGDLCDRGPDTRGVLDRLVARRARGVRGNHDEWLAQWARGDGFDTMALNRLMSGDATLQSYGVVGRTPRDVEAQAWRVPAEHRDFLDNLALAVDLEVMGERYWLVHAGIPGHRSFRALRPEQIVPWVAENHAADLLWAQVDAESMVPLDCPIIVGHSPRKRPLDLQRVLAIDTGAGTFPDGRLTAVILPERRFMSVDAGSGPQRR